MSREIIAVDIDEVLAPLHSVLLAHHNAVYGTNYEAPDPQGRYFLNHISNDSEEETLRKLKIFVDGEDFRTIQPLNGAVQALQRLNVRRDLVIITARQDFYEEFTYEWLERHFPDLFASVHFTAHVIDRGPKVPKSAIARELGATYLIDDNPDTILDAAGAGLHAILFGDYPWNQVPTLPALATRCKDWPAVEEYFNEQG